MFINQVVSLFDGCATGLQALKDAGFTVGEYHAFEIDKYAIEIAKKNHPEIIHHGSVEGFDFFSHFWLADLVIGGSPCQGFSFAGKQLAFDDPRSKLFFEFERAIAEIDPRYYLLENVKMKKEYLNVISERMETEPVLINSSTLSAQNRQRYYWCNWDVEQPEDKGLLLRDVVHEHVDNHLSDKEVEYMLRSSSKWHKEGHCRMDKNMQYEDKKSYTVTANIHKGVPYNCFYQALNEYIVPFDKTLQILDKEVERGKVGYFGKDSQANRVYYIHNKSVTLCGAAGGGAAKMGQYLFGCITPDRINKRQNGQRFSEGKKFYTLTAQDKHGILIEGYIRKLTPIECERLQTLPDNYTEGVSNTQRYKMLGNGWTCAVIEHLFRGMKNDLCKN